MELAVCMKLSYKIRGEKCKYGDFILIIIQKLEVVVDRGHIRMKNHTKGKKWAL